MITGAIWNVGVAEALGDAAAGVAVAVAVAVVGPAAAALDWAAAGIPTKADTEGMKMTAAAPAPARRSKAAETINIVRPFLDRFPTAGAPAGVSSSAVVAGGGGGGGGGSCDMVVIL